MNRLDTIAPLLLCIAIAIGAALPDIYRWMRGPQEPCTLAVTDAGDVYYCNQWRGTYSHLARRPEHYTVTVVRKDGGE